MSDVATDTDLHDPDSARAFWAEVSGVAPDDLIFPLPPEWKQQLRAALARWPWAAQRIDPSPRTAPLIPVNISPWTNDPLSGLHDGVPATALARLHDRWLWITSHPDTRHETLEWHRRRRRTSLLLWRCGKFRAALTGRPPGAPPWVNKNRM